MFEQEYSLLNHYLVMAQHEANRSPDPYRQVGCAIIGFDNELLSLGYNSLMDGFIPPDNFWQSKDERKPFMIHAEINALSKIKKGEGKIAVVTLKPCEHCLKALIAHGIKIVWYASEKELDNTDKIAAMCGVILQKIK